MPTDILPSDGEEITVRTLGLYEPDEVERDFLGPFTYEIQLLGGGTADAEYDISRYEVLGEEPPRLPTTPEHTWVEESDDWYMARDAYRYMAAKHHNERRILHVQDWLRRLSRYILHECVDKADWYRIVTQEDWDVVFYMAMVPQLSIKILTKTLQQTFQAKWSDHEIFDAMDKMSGGKGEYNSVRMWEISWSNEFGLRDEEVATMDLKERARRVCAFMMPRWLEGLEADLMRKKRLEKGGDLEN